MTIAHHLSPLTSSSAPLLLSNNRRGLRQQPSLPTLTRYRSYTRGEGIDSGDADESRAPSILYEGWLVRRYPTVLRYAAVSIHTYYLLQHVSNSIPSILHHRLIQMILALGKSQTLNSTLVLPRASAFDEGVYIPAPHLRRTSICRELYPALLFASY